MSEKEHKKEASTREFLEPLLAESETLLEFSNGQIRGATAQYYYIGLTENRIILLPYKRNKPNGPARSILLASIQEIKMARQSLKIKLISDATAIFIRGRRWRNRGRKLAETAVSLKHSSEHFLNRPSHEDLLAQSQDFYELGLIKTAQAVLGKENPENFLPTSNSLYSTLQNKIAEKMYSLRAACIILWSTLLIAILSTIIFINPQAATDMGITAEVLLAGFAFPIAIDGIITYNLWRGHTQGGWVTWALLRAGLGAAFNGISFASEGFYLDFIAQLALAASIILVLTGKPSRTKTHIGAAIYIVGFVGITLLGFLLMRINHKM